MTPDTSHNSKRRKLMVAGQVVPIVVAVIFTAAYGFWTKNQPGFQGEWQRRMGYGVSFPVVTAKLSDSGTGNPSRNRWPEAPDAGAWAWIEIADNGFSRRMVSRRLLAVTAKVRDQKGHSWPIETKAYRGGILVTVPTGYSKIADNLTLTVMAGGKNIGMWDFPSLAAPQRALLPPITESPDLTATVVPTDNSLSSKIRLQLDKPLPRDEYLKVELIAHTFRRSRTITPFEMRAGAQNMWIPSEIIGDTSDVDRVELRVERYRVLRVERRLNLSESKVKVIDGVPLLIPVPAIFEIAPGFNVTATSLPGSMVRQGEAASINLVLNSSSSYHDFSAEIVEPQAGYRGVVITLLNRVNARMLTLEESTPVAKPTDTSSVTPGDYPIVIEVIASPSEKISSKKIVLPLLHEKAAAKP